MPPLHDPTTDSGPHVTPSPEDGVRTALLTRRGAPGGFGALWRCWSGSLLLHAVLLTALAAIGVGLASAPASRPAASHAIVADLPEPELREVPPPPPVPFPEVECAMETRASAPSEPFTAFTQPTGTPEAPSADPLIDALRHDARLPGASRRAAKSAPADAATGDRTAGDAAPPTPTPTAAAAPRGRTSRARATRRPPPRYPAIARRRGWEGTVIVLVRLDASGRVAGTQLARTSGRSALDDVALAAVEEWVFEPAYEQGVAVASELPVSVEFRLTTR